MQVWGRDEKWHLPRVDPDGVPQALVHHLVVVQVGPPIRPRIRAGVHVDSNLALSMQRLCAVRIGNVCFQS